MTDSTAVERVHAAEDQVLDKAQFHGWIRANVPHGTNWRDADPPQRLLDCYERIQKRARLYGLDT